MSTLSGKDISIIIPNYNGMTLLKRFLPHNYQRFQDYGIDDVIIVDDCSTDESVPYITDTFPDIRVIKNKTNYRFAKTCNIGASYAKKSILFLLNTDIRIEHLDIKPLLAPFHKQDVFSITPHIVIPKPNQSESLTSMAFKGGYLKADVHMYSVNTPMPTQSIAWGCGGGTFISNKKFQSLKGFATVYNQFRYDDVDLCYRAWKRGWSSHLMDAGILTHFHKATINTVFKEKEIELKQCRNHYIFIWRNLGYPPYFLHHIMSIVLAFLSLKIRDIKAVVMALFHIRGIIKARHVEKREAHISDQDVLKKIGARQPLN